MNLEKISEAVIKQNQEIHFFRDDTALSVAQMIVCEAQELVEAIETGYLTDDVTSVALEAADTMYLLIRLFDLLGIDEKAIEIKVARNYEKYSGFNSHSEAREEWKKRGGDKVWFDKFIKED
jgi:NTP pyrophosphatase (non-canonical NTP hydrolase)